MKWSERFATGVSALDEQHRMLFKMSEDYREALDEQRGERVYGVLLQSLDGYARGHFQAEEGWMHRCRCPVADINTAAHADFVATIARFRTRYDDAGFQHVDASRLLDFLDDWLDRHIGTIDTQLRPCVGGPRP